MPAPVHLLIVDDDTGVQEVLYRYFAGHGFKVSTAGNGIEMRNVLARDSVDLVLLDLGLPGEDGLALTRLLRTDWNGALIIITGRGESVDRVVGLELGADDYVTKPFDLRELLARIHSVLRRSVPATAAAGSPGEATFHFADYCLDPLERTLRDARGEAVALTTGEYELLRVLVEHPNRALSRDYIMERMHGHDAGPFDRAIDVQIARLRHKIESDATNPALIKSVRGVGYLFAVRVQRGR